MTDYVLHGALLVGWCEFGSHYSRWINRYEGRTPLGVRLLVAPLVGHFEPLASEVDNREL